MAITETARRNDEALFPDHVSTLKLTDPELMELFDNRAFDEVLSDVVLEPRTRLMVQLAAIIACNGIREFRVMLGGALDVGVTLVEAKEVVCQAVPYVGMARVLDFIHATNEVFATRGIALPLAGQSTTTATTRYAQGLAVQHRLLGEAIDRMHADALADQRHIQQFLTANCFGDHLTRGGLDLATRELLTLSMLAALGGCEPQLAGHVGANLAIGNDRRTMIGTLTQLLPFIGYPRTLNALRVIDQGTS
jgi:4-carboxymuconolactone decarboxylase